MSIFCLLLCGIFCTVNAFSIRRKVDDARMDPTQRVLLERTARVTGYQEPILRVVLAFFSPILAALFGLFAVANAKSFWMALATGLLAGLAVGAALCQRVGFRRRVVVHRSDAVDFLRDRTMALSIGGAGLALLLVLVLAGMGWGTAIYVPLVLGTPAVYLLVVRRIEGYHARRVALAPGLAAWLGYASVERFLKEVAATVEPDASIVIRPLPPKVRADLARYMKSIGQVMPDYAVAEADVDHLVLVPVPEEEAARRQLVAESGGVFVGRVHRDDDLGDPAAPVAEFDGESMTGLILGEE